MDGPTVQILDIPISTLGMENALRVCETRARNGAGGYICFANVHTVTESMENSDLKDALRNATLAVADGMPLVWVSRWKGNSVQSRVCGPDFMKLFLKSPGLRHGFIGGVPGQAEKLALQYAPGAPWVSPPFRPFSPEAALEDWQSLVKNCASGPLPQVVWVGLGAPKQELWMRSVSEKVPNVLFMGVGAAFDFLTETKKRAPLWMRNSGLEWLFRLFQEPRRLWRRYFVTNSRFIYALMGEIRLIPKK